MPACMGTAWARPVPNRAGLRFDWPPVAGGGGGGGGGGVIASDRLAAVPGAAEPGPTGDSGATGGDDGNRGFQPSLRDPPEWYGYFHIIMTHHFENIAPYFSAIYDPTLAV